MNAVRESDRPAPTVLVTSRSFGSGHASCADQLADAGLRVVRGGHTHVLGELATDLRQSVAWIAGTGPITGEHLDAAPHLKVIARYGVGVDAVDLDAAARRGVVVTNTPAANSDAVADLAVALLLAALRGLPAGDRAVRAGDWRARRGHELGALTVGVAGLGRIGSGVVRRLTGFGSAVRGYDPYADPSGFDLASPATLADLADCDAVTLHAPGGATLVDAEWLATARPGLVLVNTARADLVDEPAVARALRAGTLGGYATDMLRTEHDTDSPLLAEELADRVIITPHLGAHTVEAVDRMGTGAVRAVLDVLAGRPPQHPVATPAI